MATLPTNRTTQNTEIEHVDDHNELHSLHNDLQSLDGLASATVASGDIVLIEDVSDSNNRRKTTAQDIANLGAGGADGDAIHDNVAGEITPLTSVALTAADNFIIEDNSDSNNKKRATGQAILDLVGAHDDPDAIHDDVSGEINAVTAKGTLAIADVVLIEDSEATFAKKKTTVQDIADLAGVTRSQWISANMTADWGDGDLMVDVTGGSKTILLPDATTYDGLSLFIQRWGSSNTLTVDLEQGTDTIYDETGTAKAQVTLDTNMAAIAVRAINGAWYTANAIGTVTWT